MAFTFDTDVRETVAAARALAHAETAAAVAPVHLAIAAARRLEARGVLDAAMALALSERLPRPRRASTVATLRPADLPFSGRGYKALEGAMRLASDRGDPSVGVGHLLAGVVWAVRPRWWSWDRRGRIAELNVLLGAGLTPAHLDAVLAAESAA